MPRWQLGVGAVLVFGMAACLPGMTPAVRAQSISTEDPPSTPVSVKVRLDGRFRFYTGYYGDSQFNRAGVDASGAPYANEQSSFGTYELVRLYPGFDAVTAAGWKFGASVELRQDNLVAPGGGLNGTVSASNRARGAVYVRREWGYIGNDTYGTLRFGTQSGPAGLFLAGTSENFNDGGWNGDAPRGLAGNAQLVWPFANVGDINVADKIIYLSPAVEWEDLGRFDGGISFEPSTAGAGFTNGNCPYAITAPGYGCDRLSSTTVAAESARRRDTFEVALRWRQAFGPVGVIAEGAYISGSNVAYQGPGVVAQQTPAGTVYNRVVTYEGLGATDLGVAATYAGFQLGANYQFGRFNNSTASGASTTLALPASGGKGASAWIAGGSYHFGPAVLGASYLSIDSQGALAYPSAADPAAALAAKSLLGQRHETGIAAGGTLKLVPGVAVFLSYLYGERRQTGYDFVAGSAGSDSNNSVHANVLTFGTSLTW